MRHKCYNIFADVITYSTPRDFDGPLPPSHLALGHLAANIQKGGILEGKIQLDPPFPTFNQQKMRTKTVVKSMFHSKKFCLARAKKNSQKTQWLGVALFLGQAGGKWR